MHYLYLFISIATEIIGTSFLKTSEGFTKLWPTLGTLLSFGICFYFLSLTIKFLPLNITSQHGQNKVLVVPNKLYGLL